MKVFLIPPNDLLRHPIPNRMYHIARKLSRKHGIYLLSYTNHPLVDGIKKRGLKAVEIPVSNAVRVRNLGLYYVVNAPQIYASIKRVIDGEGIDVVIHANILPSLIASKLAKRFGVPNIYDYLDHYPESASAYYSQGRQFVELGVRLFVSQALKNSDAVVTPSYGLKRVVSTIIPGKPVYVVPNGVDAELFKPQDRNSARRMIGLDTNCYLLLLQGSLDVWMDIAGIIKVLSRLHRMVDVKLLVVGVSHAKHYYRLLLKYAKHYGINKHVYIYPPQPYERMPIFINSSDIVFAPYLKTVKNLTTPLKIAEALACGVPVVTTNIVEFRLWYKQGIYTYSTYAELENILKQLLSNIDTIRATLRKNSYSFREAFSWDRLAEKYEILIKALRDSKCLEC
jgi:glycosyltransferase involved in cell wall biosynthesis